MTKEIANRVKQLRMQRRYSMAQLAERSGVTRSMISQLEKGEALPSLQTLNRIAEALDVSLSEFFHMEGADNDEENSIIVRAGMHKRIVIPGSEAVYNILSPDMSNPMEFLLIDFPAGESESQFKHDGTEFFYVLEGELTMTLSQKTYVLRAGDSGCFNSMLAHHLSNLSDKTAKILIAANQSNQKQR